MPRTNVVVRKSVLGAPSVVAAASGVAATSGLGAIVRVASSRRVPSGGAATAHAGSAAASASSVWQSFTAPTFTHGVASSWSFASYAPSGAANFIIGTAGQTATTNSAKVAELAALGITLNSASKTLVYDGVGSAGSVSGVILEDIPTAEADWQARIGGAGVVWYHDFRNQREVDAFRWSLGVGSGNDPANTSSRPTMVTYGAGQGITGGALKMRHEADGNDGTHWWRPYAPLLASTNSNGLLVNDPAANGTLTRRAWNPTAGGGQMTAFDGGYYGHSSYASGNSFFDGTEYWLQYRCKRDLRRVTGGNEDIEVGKHLYLADTNTSGLAPQEYVIWSNGGGPNNNRAMTGVNGFRVYHNEFSPLDGQGSPQDNTNHQPGGVTAMWQWNSGSWDTVMYHHKPGREGIQEETFEVYGAHAGETSWTLFWSQTAQTSAYRTSTRRGFNAAIFSTYNNGSNFFQPYEDLFCQIIFSLQPIPCPQV